MVKWMEDGWMSRWMTGKTNRKMNRYMVNKLMIRRIDGQWVSLWMEDD